MAYCKTLDGMKEIKVGDTVGFKSDYEQYGTVTKIELTTRGFNLHLHNPDGFGGEYLRYATDTVERSDDCWVD